MGANIEVLRELLVMVLGVARRRWKIFLLPPLIALVLSSCALSTSSLKYSATSLILIQGANRAAAWSNGMQQTSAIDQVNAIETWLKSDPVLGGLLPSLVDGPLPDDPDSRLALISSLRARLSLELLNGSVLQIKLDDAKPTGLGRKLESVVARLMEALTGPEQGLFNASQFVLAARKDALATADNALSKAIESSGSQAPESIYPKLKQLDDLTQPRMSPTSAFPGPAEPDPGSSQAAAISKIRSEISEDPAVTKELERRYKSLQRAKIALDGAMAAASNSRAYVGIFASPEDLVVIGRPEDPLKGQVTGLKMVIAGFFFSIILGGVLVVLSEIFGGLLKLRSEYETLTGLPVVARIPRLRHA